MYIAVIGITALALLLVYGYCLNFFLKKEYYSISIPGCGKNGTVKRTKVPGSSHMEQKPVRILLLADLHGASFGKENGRLLSHVRETNPDLICIAGDMTVKDGRGAKTGLALCRELLTVCPVYYAVGNHEIQMPCYEEYCSELRKMGVSLLDNECREHFIYGRKLVVYGWNTPRYYFHKFWQRREPPLEELREQLGAPDEGAYRILLAHNPEYFRAYHAWGADLVFSGHVHGGIARLPFLGGVIDPALRLFPQYDAGMYQEGSTAMVVSRGLGTHHIRLRFFNIPEISVIDLQ